MKFLIDLPLPPAMAGCLIDQGHDAVHAVDLSLHRAADSEIISRAKRELRTVISTDLDYPRYSLWHVPASRASSCSATAIGPKIKCGKDWPRFSLTSPNTTLPRASSWWIAIA